MSTTPRTDAIVTKHRPFAGSPLAEQAFDALSHESRMLERELTTLRAKLAEAEKDAERKDSALRVARAAVTLGTTDGGKAVVKLIDAAIEKERSRG